MAPISVTTLRLSHLPRQPIYVALFKDVANAPALLERVQAAGRDEENVTERSDLEYAFLDAASILSTTHVLSAVYRAISDRRNNRLKSKNVHSEIVFSLSPNNNIGESFRRFGVSKSTASLLVVKVPDEGSSLSPEDVASHLANRVRIQGTSIPYSDESISSCSDLANIKKIYKITDDSSTKKPKRKRNDDDQANGVSNGVAVDEQMLNIESIILGTMALRGS